MGIQEVGELFESGEVFLPELMMSADAMAGATEVTNAALEGAAAEAKGTVVIGTVQGDVHDIGKAIVIAYLKANGYVVHDLGRDVPADSFITRAAEEGADVIGMSALLTTTMEEQKKVIKRVRDEGLRLQVRRRRRPRHAALGRPDRRRRLRRGRQRRRQEDQRAARGLKHRAARAEEGRPRVGRLYDRSARGARARPQSAPAPSGMSRPGPAGTRVPPPPGTFSAAGATGTRAERGSDYCDAEPIGGRAGRPAAGHRPRGRLFS